MATKKSKRRGLGALGVDVLMTSVQPVVLEDENSKAQLQQIPVGDIRPGHHQPRTQMDEESLRELAASIKNQGLIQPVVVRSNSDGPQPYELVAGERRWRAAKLAGLERIPALVRTLDENDAAAVALIENIQRENLNPLEEASAIQQLIIKFDLTHEQIAGAIGRSRPAVSNLLRLLELSSEVRDRLSEGRIEMGHARTLLRLDKNKQTQAAQAVIQKEMSVRETEAYVESLLKGENDGRRKPRKPGTTPEIDALQQTLSERLGAPTVIQHSAKSGRGKLLIRYASLDELDGILEKIH